jgi:hypothetical protein
MEVRLFTSLIALFGFFFGFLLTLVRFKYQSSGATLFHAHNAIMVLLIIDVCTCTIAFTAVMLTNFNVSYLPFLNSVSLISRAFANDLLILIIVPPFGWFIFTIWVFVLVCLLYGKYQHIFQCCQEILRSISHSTFDAFDVLCNWFQQNFLSQSIKQIPSQTSNGSPMLTRGGFGSGGSGFGQIRCPSVENNLTDNPSVEMFGRAGRLSGFGGRVVGFIGLQMGFFGFFWACKLILKIQPISYHFGLFGAFLGHFKAKSTIICYWAY